MRAGLIPVPSGMVTMRATGHLSVTKTQSSPRQSHRPLVKHTAASGAPEGDSIYHRQKLDMQDAMCHGGC